MSDSPADPIGYLASCYEADNRESSIFDLFHKEIQHRHFATGTEVLSSGLQDGLAIPMKRGLAALKAAATYKREMSLIYGVFLIVGKYKSSDGTERKLAAPVLYYPARLHQTKLDDQGEAIVYLSIERAEQRINFPVTKTLLYFINTESERVEKIIPISVSTRNLVVHHGEGELYLSSHFIVQVVDLEAQEITRAFPVTQQSSAGSVSAGRLGRIFLETYRSASIMDTSTGDTEAILRNNTSASGVSENTCERSSEKMPMLAKARSSR